MRFKPIDVELICSLLEYRPEVGGSCLVWKVNVGRYGKVKAGSRTGWKDRKGYWLISINGKRYRAHRLVWIIVYGEDPPCQIDHINGCEAGNHIENLRLAINNDVDNQQNRKTQKNNTSGYTGVSWCKSKRKWRGTIMHEGKRYHLGLFDTPEEAYAAYLKAKAELHTFQPVPRSIDSQKLEA